MNYVPLYIDPSIEQSQISWSRRLLRGLSHYLPFLVYYEVPYGRKSLKVQLAGRRSTPVAEWEERGVAFNDVKPILEVIATELNLPNANLLPDDPLSVVLISDYDDFPLAWLHHGLERKLKIPIDFDELHGWIGGGKSRVVSLVQQLLLRIGHTNTS